MNAIEQLRALMPREWEAILIFQDDLVGLDQPDLRDPDKVRLVDPDEETAG